ncbi:hypothetical protein VTP01DRAFT_6732 [Rhizomucor pusillus]|uniref:uncharacterized protein n=1 Tax=Rhizomucor pusillus TaxID=4840 RepID=UPI003742B4BE
MDRCSHENNIAEIMESIREYFWTYHKHTIPVDRIVSYLSVDHHHADNLSFKNHGHGCNKFLVQLSNAINRGLTDLSAPPYYHCNTTTLSRAPGLATNVEEVESELRDWHPVFNEDGQGNAVDEYGRPEPMDYVVDEEQYAFETRSSYTQYLRNLPCESIHGSDTMQTGVAKKDVDILMREASVKRAYTLYTDQDKLPQNSCISTFTRLKDEPSSMRILIASSRSVKKNGRPPVLEQLMERLLQRFEGLKVSKSTVYDFVRTQCNLSLNPVSACRQEQRGPRFRSVLTEFACNSHGAQNTSADNHHFGTISASGLINCSLRLLRPPAKKRKRGGCGGLISTGTVTGHYLSFLKATVDEMDRYPHMKGHYLVMDNAPIHTSNDIAKYITSRGYRHPYLPSYSPELNPIEQFWSVVKSNVKRSWFLEKEALTTRTTRAADSLKPSDYNDFVLAFA